MDDKLRREITRRVAGHKQDLENADAMRAHVAALADVFDVDPEEVQAIAAKAVAERRAGRPAPRRALAALSRFQVLAGFVAAAVVLVIGAWLLVSRLFPGSMVASDDHSNYMKAAIVSNILASVMPIKMMVNEYYMSQGEYPASFEDLGFEREEMRTADHVEDIVLGDDGAIIVESDDSPGEVVYLVLYPEETMGGLNMSWRCLLSTKIVEMRSCSKADVSKFASQL